MIVRVPRVRLDDVAIDVADRNLRFGPGDTHGFQFQVRRGSRGVLGRRLVDGQADFRPFPELAFDQVLVQDLFGDCVFHKLSPSLRAAAWAFNT